jgi:hypothetical protein
MASRCRRCGSKIDIADAHLIVDPKEKRIYWLCSKYVKLPLETGLAKSLAGEERNKNEAGEEKKGR